MVVDMTSQHNITVAKDDVQPLKMTKNRTGFDMGIPCYKIEEWISAYDRTKPLYDIGSGE